MSAGYLADADDRQLLARTAAGDRDAFTRLVERHQTAIWRYLRLTCADPARAEDALQETFIAALRGAATFRGELSDSARGWLMAIARRQLARLRRQRAGEPRHLEPLESLGAAAGWGDLRTPEVIALALERRGILERALAALADSDREVLALCELQELPLADAAKLLGCSLAATKSRLHRARLRLMGELRRLTDATEDQDAG